MKKILFFAAAMVAVTMVACGGDDALFGVGDYDYGDGDDSSSSGSGCTCTYTPGGTVSYSASELSGMSCSEFATHTNKYAGGAYTVTCK